VSHLSFYLGTLSVTLAAKWRQIEIFKYLSSPSFFLAKLFTLWNRKRDTLALGLKMLKANSPNVYNFFSVMLITSHFGLWPFLSTDKAFQTISFGVRNIHAIYYIAL